jgi:hypothetical protein
VPPAHVRELRQLLSQRRQLVETHTQIVNRRHSLAHRHHLKHDRGKRFNKKTTGSQKDKNLSALEQFQLESEGAFCLSQFTHKRTLPKNANQMKIAIYSQTDSPQECQSNEKYHETKLFSCQSDHQGLHIRHEYLPASARLALP